MLESTKTGAVMRLLARQVWASAPQKRLASQRPSHRRFIAVLGGHTFLQQFTQKPRNTRIPPRRLYAGPLGHVFFQGDGNITELCFDCHENSVTRNQCISQYGSCRVAALGCPAGSASKHP